MEGSQFEFKCPQCGETVSADESLRGLVLYCPYCEKGIVVPKRGAVVENRPQPAPIASRAIADAGKPPEQTVNYNFAAIRKRMEDKYQDGIIEAERSDQLKKSLRAMKFRSMLARAAVAVIVVGLCAAAFLWWKGDQRRIAAGQLRQNALAEDRADATADAAKGSPVADGRNAEMEREHKKIIDEMERRKKESEKRRAEAEKARKDRLAEENARRNMQAERRRRFDEVVGLFSGKTGLPWRDRPKELRIGEVDGVFHCLVTGADGKDSFFEVKSGEGGLVEARLLSRNDEDKAVSHEEYEGMVLENGGLFAYGGQVYAASPKNDKGGQYPVADSVNPAELVFRNVYRSIARRRIDASGMSFDVAYVPAGGGSEIHVGAVPFGQTLRRRDIVEAVFQAGRRSIKPPKAKAKGKRATVVWYDGDIVKRSLNGVTYVPRSPKGNIDRSYSSLCVEADRQASLAREAEEAAANAEKAALEGFKRHVESSLDSGKLKIQVKKRASEKE